MTNIFGAAYVSSGTPVSIVTHYLSAFTRRQIAEPPPSCQPFSAKEYDIRKAYIACSFKGQYIYTHVNVHVHVCLVHGPILQARFCSVMVSGVQVDRAIATVEVSCWICVVVLLKRKGKQTSVRSRELEPRDWKSSASHYSRQKLVF